MKLLIVTQKVDRADPILGFFHAWIGEFSTRCEGVTVIGQSVGRHNFPKNVSVRSLGKENDSGLLTQICMFWKYIFGCRGEYDAVFVHMTPIWVVLGAPLWMALGKRVYLWYEIKRGSIKLAVALWFVRNVFMASEHGLPSHSKKQVVTGHGIDTADFAPDPARRESGHIVTAGRVTGIKHYELIARMFAKLPPSCRLTIAGGTVTEDDKQVEHDLRELMHRLGIAKRVEVGWVAPADMPLLLQRADVFVHASQGGLDKALLQAMACGCPVVSVSTAARGTLPETCHATSEKMAEKVEHLLSLSATDRTKLTAQLRTTVEREHGLRQCIDRLVSAMQRGMLPVSPLSCRFLTKSGRFQGSSGVCLIPARRLPR